MPRIRTRPARRARVYFTYGSLSKAEGLTIANSDFPAEAKVAKAETAVQDANDKCMIR